MNQAFWDLFGHDWRANCRKWRRSPNNPVIPASGHTWKKIWTANPDVIEFNGRRLLYYRGHGPMPDRADGNHDRIAAAEIITVTRDRIQIRDLNDGQPVVDVGQPGSFDDRHALDPAALAYCGSVLLYCSAVGSQEDSVGLSISHDGANFRKFGSIMPGRAPEVVVKDGLVHMIFQKYIADHYEVFLAKSPDGIKFDMVQHAPVLAPSPAGAWDAFDVCTPRVAESDGLYYMIYAASADKCDVPDHFGLARSTDLVNWERHPGNPIFGIGPRGAPDGGAIWFPALLEEDDFFAILYEGTQPGQITSQICQASIDK